MISRRLLMHLRVRSSSSNQCYPLISWWPVYRIGNIHGLLMTVSKWRVGAWLSPSMYPWVMWRISELLLSNPEQRRTRSTTGSFLTWWDWRPCPPITSSRSSRCWMSTPVASSRRRSSSEKRQKPKTHQLAQCYTLIHTNTRQSKTP